MGLKPVGVHVVPPKARWCPTRSGPWVMDVVGEFVDSMGLEESEPEETAPYRE